MIIYDFAFFILHFDNPMPIIATLIANEPYHSLSNVHSSIIFIYKYT